MGFSGMHDCPMSIPSTFAADWRHEDGFRRGGFAPPKSEIRRSKCETNPNQSKIENPKRAFQQGLFRISDFVLRISDFGQSRRRSTMRRWIRGYSSWRRPAVRGKL